VHPGADRREAGNTWAPFPNELSAFALLWWQAFWAGSAMGWDAADDTLWLCQQFAIENGH